MIFNIEVLPWTAVFISGGGLFVSHGKTPRHVSPVSTGAAPVLSLAQDHPPQRLARFPGLRVSIDPIHI